jgi:hypothetical protein
MGKLIGNLSGGSPDDSVAVGSTSGGGSMSSGQQPPNALTKRRTFAGTAPLDLGGANAAPTFTPNQNPDLPPDMSALMSGPLPAVGAQPQVSNTPSFLQALNSGPGGMPNALSSGLTTKGKILSVILAAAKGGLAGEAAGLQGNPRTGYGGFGAGYETASQLPFIDALQKQRVQQGQIQQQMEQAQIAGIPGQRAQQAATLAQTQAATEKDKAQATEATARAGSLANPVEKTLEQRIADAANKAISEGRDPNQDPIVKSLSDVKTGLQKQPVPPKPDTPEQQFIDEYQRTHQGAGVQAAERAFALNQRVVDPAVAASRTDARSDKSYQYNAARLDKLRTPIESSLDRLTRAEQNVHLATPQSDALVAPELLSVMAGGQGSGLRMNEAEISRIVGGRSNWESLKAAVNKWQTDPSKALSITPSQRGQISQIIGLEKTRLGAKQAVIDEEGSNLLNSEDVKEHRTIVNRAQKRLGEIDAGGGVGNGHVTMRAPNGQTRAVSPDQVEHYKSLGATLVAQ